MSELHFISWIQKDGWYVLKHRAKAWNMMTIIKHQRKGQKTNIIKGVSNISIKTYNQEIMINTYPSLSKHKTDINTTCNI